MSEWLIVYFLSYGMLELIHRTSAIRIGLITRLLAPLCLAPFMLLGDHDSWLKTGLVIAVSVLASAFVWLVWQVEKSIQQYRNDQGAQDIFSVTLSVTRRGRGFYETGYGGIQHHASDERPSEGRPASATGLENDSHKKTPTQHSRPRSRCFVDHPPDPGRRPYALYLRPFASTNDLATQGDNMHFMPYGQPWQQGPTPHIDLETVFEQALQPLMPLVALGTPAEMLGAGRIPSTDLQWQNDFVAVAQFAALFVVLPSDSKGTIWEMQWLIDYGRLPRTY